eukprot:18929-Rhodomonas_salina.2
MREGGQTEAGVRAPFLTGELPQPASTTGVVSTCAAPVDSRPDGGGSCAPASRGSVAAVAASSPPCSASRCPPPLMCV